VIPLALRVVRIGGWLEQGARQVFIDIDFDIP
jgi:hypothetical protein